MLNDSMPWWSYLLLPLGIPLCYLIAELLTRTLPGAPNRKVPPPPSPIVDDRAVRAFLELEDEIRSLPACGTAAERQAQRVAYTTAIEMVRAARRDYQVDFDTPEKLKTGNPLYEVTGYGNPAQLPFDEELDRCDL